MPKKSPVQSSAKPAKNSMNIEKAKGRPLLQWVGKRPLEKVEYYPAQEKEVYGDKTAKEFNKLFWGDNLQVLSHLLKEYRGAVDLIYIDPPFDSEADYVKKVKIKGEKIAGVQQSLIEEAQYADVWGKDEYLQFMYERLILLRELLSDHGTIYVHCDWHKNSYLKVLMDEIFDGYEFAEIVWVCGLMGSGSFYPKSHETIYCYKSPKAPFHPPPRLGYSDRITKALQKDEKGWYYTRGRESSGGTNYLKSYISDNPKLTKEEAITDANEKRPQTAWDVWMGKEELAHAFNDYPLGTYAYIESESTDYPTQKPKELLERIISASSQAGDLVMDCFVGSGATCVAAQKLGRRWIGCDINIGAIQTTTKRLNQLISEQAKEKIKDFKGSLGFKVLNVNEYDVFKNEVEAKTIVMETYGVEPIKRSYFDGILDNDFVKVLPLNRVLGKMDIHSLLKGVSDEIDNFSKKTVSKHNEAVYNEGVVMICSGMELDVRDFLKKENKTGVEVKIYDILTDTKDLIFKQYPESRVKVATKGLKITIEIQEFYSPLLMRKIEIENGKVLKKEYEAKVDDFKQIVDSVAIDVDYNGKLFNAEIMDLPDKKEVITAKYTWEYPKKGTYTIAVKIIDVLGEEYFETFEVAAK
jgi:DNA modification methylase